MRLLCLAIIAGGCIVLSCTANLVADDTFRYEEKLARLAAPYFEHKIIQSASVGVVLDDKAWFFSFGQLGDAPDERPDENTLFEIGSITKVFTGILLADAAGRDVVGLDQPIAIAAPELAKLNPDLMNRITFRQLSQHMSGLPRMPAPFRPADPNNPYADYDRRKLHELLATQQLLVEPGTRHEYSNLACGLLGDLLAAKAGVDYESLLRDRILKPLAMPDTFIVLTVPTRSRLAPPTKPVVNLDRTLTPDHHTLTPDHHWDFDALAGAGAIRSSVKDMVRFMQANLDPPDGEVGEAIDLAWRQSLPAGKGHRAMGLGWMIAGDGSTRWHSGQTGGYHSMILVNRALRAGVVLLCNTSTTEADQLAESIFQTIVGMDVKPRVFDR